MFRNRGEIPNIGNDIGDELKEGGYTAPHYRNYWNGRYFVIKYDKKFVLIEIIAVLIMLIIGASVYVFTYKTWFEDPIDPIKNNFLTAQLVSIIVKLVAICAVTFFNGNSRERLINNLKIILIIFFISVIVFLGIKINMDKKYNENTFKEFYKEYAKISNSKNSNRIKIGMSEIKIVDERESYIGDSIKAYEIFTIKTIIYMVLDVVIIFLTMYLVYRLTNIEIKKERLIKDDNVLYDDEQNVKY